MDVQSLLFDRDAGWTPSTAKAWAKSHGYKYGKVHSTDQYVRIRQFDPKGFKVKRTIPFGRGIRAVVAREREGDRSMTIQEARRSRRRRTTKEAPKRKPKRRRAASKAARKPRRRRASEARRSRPRRRRAAAPMVMETKRKPRRVRRVRRKARRATEWRGDSAGHRKAARKGWRRKKKAARRSTRRTREPSVVAEATKRRRPRRARRTREYNYTMEARRSRRGGRRTREAAKGQRGMQMAQLAIAVASGGLGFVIADGLDRLLSTYDPAATEKPKDKFTSDGAGTLANTLNVASPPGFMRLAAGLGVAAVPAVGAAFVVNPFLRSSLEGAAIGAGVNLFKTLWNNLLMPALRPKDTSPASLQKSYIARLYPAEVAAAINLAAKKDATTGKMAEGPYPAAGVLSNQPAAGVGAQADVGPFAVGAESPYPDAAQALRSAAGVQGPGGDYPTQQNVWGTGAQVAEYPTAAQAMGTGAPTGVSAWAPNQPPGTGPGPSARTPDEGAACACLGEDNPFLGFVGDEDTANSPFLM
jgi:hypothetical protein